MLLTFDDIAKRFEDVISGDLGREEADRWALEIMQASDAGKVEYAPAADEARIWRGVTYLLGIDLCEKPETYLHDLENIRAAYIAIRDGSYG